MEFEHLNLDPNETYYKKLSFLAQRAFEKLSFYFTPRHLEHLITIASDTNASANDLVVAKSLLQNACIASEGVLPLCQDTGIAQIFAWKDEDLQTFCDDQKALSNGALACWQAKNLRNSTNQPLGLFDEKDPQDNSPCQISITPNFSGSHKTYRFLFCAKGGGSSNKTSLFQGTKALLNEKSFTEFLQKSILNLGTSACPPYTIAIVVGGLSPEQNLLALKLATASYFNQKLPLWDYKVFGVEPCRIPEWEHKVLTIAQKTGLGAQFGGTAFASDAIVLRLPRHGASCPVSIGVSCVAHRNLHGYIDESGLYLEKTVTAPSQDNRIKTILNQDLEKNDPTQVLTNESIDINLDDGLNAALTKLSQAKPGTSIALSGWILVARDQAHARWKKLLDEGKTLPEYTSQYPILYAGPAKTPKSHPIGSFGPTTAGRMDEYAELFMSQNVGRLTIAKGNRSSQWKEACAQYHGFYLGTIGGAAALIAQNHIKEVTIIDYPELGMEAVRLVKLDRLPCFVIINDKGEDFYA